MAEQSYEAVVPEGLALAIGDLITEWAAAQRYLINIVGELMVGHSLSNIDDRMHMTALTGMDARVLMGLFSRLLKKSLPISPLMILWEGIGGGDAWR